MTPPDQTLAVLTEDLKELRAVINYATESGLTVLESRERREQFNRKVSPQTLSAVLAALPAREEEAKTLRELVERARKELRLIRMKDCGAVYDVTLRLDLSAALHAPQPQGIGSPTGDA